MNSKKDDMLCISPLENYEAPDIPNLDASRKDNALLKKLPLRWQKKAAVISCLGLLGATALSGCAYYDLVSGSGRIHHGGGAAMPIYFDRVIEPETPANITVPAAEDLELRIHFGGGGFGPIYIVHLTEQEALAIIRSQLEAEGLNFGADPPDYDVDFNSWLDFSVGLELFDEENGVAVAHISWENNNIQFFSHGGRHLADEVAEKFAELNNDISIGVFYNPGESLGMGADWWGWESEDHPLRGDLGEEYQEPNDEIKAEARKALVDRLTAQVQDFVERLRAEGII